LGQNRTENLRQGNEDKGSEHGTGDTPHATEDYEAEDEDGFPELEHIRVNELEPSGEESTSHRANGGAYGEGNDFVAYEVNATALRCNLILSYSKPGPP